MLLKRLGGDSMKTWARVMAYIFILILVVVISYAAIRNYKDNKEFWDLSFFNIATLAVAVSVSFYLTQRFSDIRKKKEIFQLILTDIQGVVGAAESYSINEGTEQEIVLMRLRGTNAKLTSAQKCAGKLGISKDMNFICDKFREYETFVSDHISDMGYLSKSTKELQRPLNLIYDRIYEMLIKLY
jgi:hypothetical protein